MPGTRPGVTEKKSCSRLGRQAGLLPGLDAPGKVRGVRKALVLRDKRGRDRAIARAARKYDLLAAGIGQRGRIELRHRHVNGFRIALDVGLARLAHVDEENLSFSDALGHLFRVEVLHAVASERHGISPYAGHFRAVLYRLNGKTATPQRYTVT